MRPKSQLLPGIIGLVAWTCAHAPDPDQPRFYAAALGAHHICSGTFVVGMSSGPLSAWNRESLEWIL